MPQNDISSIPQCEKRIKQAIQVGYVEMERIVDEVITTEFERLGEVLMKHDHAVEIILFDTESEIDGSLHLCGAGLSIGGEEDKSAIVFTGDPHNFQFSLQTQSEKHDGSECSVDYHKLTPNWFHNNVRQFVQESFPDVDLSEIQGMFVDDWHIMEGPFSIKVKIDEGTYEEVADAESIERAFQICSYAAELHYNEEDLIVTDKNGVEVG